MSGPLAHRPTATWNVVPGWRETQFIFADGKVLAEVSGTAKDAALITAAPQLYLILESCVAEVERYAQAIADHDPPLRALMLDLASEIRTLLANVNREPARQCREQKKRTEKEVRDA